MLPHKQRLYGVIQGFREGKLPSNRQIDETLDYFVSTAPFDTSKLSKEGQELIDGFRQVVMTAKKLLLTKNQDELIQNFIWSEFRPLQGFSICRAPASTRPGFGTSPLTFATFLDLASQTRVRLTTKATLRTSRVSRLLSTRTLHAARDRKQ